MSEADTIREADALRHHLTFDGCQLYDHHEECEAMQSFLAALERRAEQAEREVERLLRLWEHENAEVPEP